MTPCIHHSGTPGDKGYVAVRVGGGRKQRAHRIAYEAKFGPIPLGMVLDHLCHNADETCAGGSHCEHRRCVNPEHLEPVTVAENNRRGRVNATKNACSSGHPYNDVNTHVEQLAGGKTARRCLSCRRQRDASRRAKPHG